MKRKHKILSALLSACMVVSMLPTVAFAADTSTQLADTVTVKGVQVTTKGKIIENSAVDSADLSGDNLGKVTLTYGQASGEGETVLFATPEEGEQVEMKTVTGLSEASSQTVETQYGSGTALTTTQALDVSEGAAKTFWIVGKVWKTAQATDKNYYVVKADVSANDDAEIKTGSTIADKNIEFGTAGEGIDGSEIAKAIPLTATIPYSTSLSTTTIKLKVGIGAKVKWVVDTKDAASPTVTDEKTSTAGALQDITNADLHDATKRTVYFEVKAADTSTTKYYRLDVTVSDADTTLSSAKIRGQEIDGDEVELPTSFTPADEITLGTITIPYADSLKDSETKTDCSVTATSDDVVKSKELYYIPAGTEVTKTLLASLGSGGSEYKKLSEIDSNIEDGSTIIAKVVGKDSDENIRYYGWNVTVTPATTSVVIKSGTFNDIDIEDAEGNKGPFTGNESQSSATPLKVTVQKSAAPSNGTLLLDVTSPVASVKYAVDTPTSYTSVEEDSTTAGKYEVTSIAPTAKKIYIEVTPEDGKPVYYELTLNSTSYVVTDETTDQTKNVVAPVEDVEGVDSNKAADVEEAANKIKLNGADPLENIALEEVMENQDSYSPDIALQEYKKEFPTEEVEEGELYIHVVSYLGVAVTEYKESEKVYTVDITPMYYVAASKEATAAALNFGVGKNAVMLGDGRQELDVTGKTVTVEIPMPESRTFTDDEQLYAHHSASDGKTYVYADAQLNDDKVTFENPHGFSPITVKGIGGVAEVKDAEGNVIETFAELQDAINAVPDGGTITLSGDTDLSGTYYANTKPGTFTLSKGTYTHDLDDINILSNTYDVQETPAGNGNVVYTVTTKAPTTDPGDNNNPSQPGGGQVTPGGNDGNDNQSGTTTTYNVNLPASVENGVVTADKAKAAKGDKVTLTVKANDGYDIDTVTVTDKDGEAVEVTKNDDGTYSFTMPESDVNVAASFKKSDAEPEDTVCKPYGDVDPDEWYHPYVHYMIENGYMTGTETGKFSPNMTLNRAMVAQILYAKAGKPTVSAITNRFSDVKSGDWYAEAVTWASENGVTAGYANGTFRPYNAVTREELAVMIYGDAGKTSVTGTLNTYPDYQSVSDWAVSGVTWAVQNKVITGVEQADKSVTLSPAKGTMRSEAAAMFMQYFTNVKK